MTDPTHEPVQAPAGEPGSVMWSPEAGTPLPYGNEWLQCVFDRLFPEHGLARREDQLAMANFVETALVKGQHLLAEAGVGTGKTLAYLIPGLGHARRTGRPLLIATHTLALQRQLATEDIPAAAELLGLPVEVVVAKGKEHFVCPARLEQYRAQHQPPNETESRLYAWAETTRTGDRAEIQGLPEALWREVNWGASGPCAGHCAHAATCPSARTRQRALETRGVIVTNHHQFFADMALRGHGHPLFALPGAIVLDEAHAIFDTAREVLGHRVSLQELKRAIAATRRELGRDADGLGLLLSAVDAFADQLASHVQWQSDEEAERFAVRREAPLLETALRLQEGAMVVVDALRSMTSTAGRRRAADRLERAIAPVQGLLFPEATIAWVEGRPHRHEVTAVATAPRDLAGVFKERLFGRDIPVVLTSATLALDGHFDYTARRAGLEHPLVCRAGSPFDYARQARLYMPDDLPDPGADADAFYRAAIERLQELIEATDGRTLVLFTAKRRAEEAFKRLKAWGRYPIVHQNRADATLLERFKRDKRSVLLGTAFWEGIDIPGDTLSSVVIVKLPFPASDPLIAAREEAARSAGLDPFDAVLLPEMRIKLAQGAGRLIRSATDRGVISVLDPRAVTRERYREAVAASLPDAPRVADLEAIRAFLAGG